MKQILISIKPKYVADILNHKKTIEVRKSMPKCDLPIEVYIYCTKDNHQLVKPKDYDKHLLFTKGAVNYSHEQTFNGKVVAKFTLNKVVEYINGGQWHKDNTFGNYDDYINDKILEKSCLNENELFAYCEDLFFFAWHIDNLEIFDKPKELSEFKNVSCEECPVNYMCTGTCPYKLTKAPQDFMYIEVEN